MLVGLVPSGQTDRQTDRLQSRGLPSYMTERTRNLPCVTGFTDTDVWKETDTVIVQGAQVRSDLNNAH
jgi:hypothetical protein